MFEKIKKWYQMGLWNEEQVRNAARKGIITKAQMEAILYENA